MKRKLYFLLERLEISKNERISLTILMVLFSILTTATLLYEPSLNYSEAEYERLEALFNEKSRSAEQQRRDILARYEPFAPESEPFVSEFGSIAAEPGSFTPESEPMSVQFTGQLADTTSPEKKSESAPEGQASGLININTATEEELQKLPGIGPAYASRIVEWRMENGRFTSAEQLIEIKGIGEKRLENIRPLVTL